MYFKALKALQSTSKYFEVLQSTYKYLSTCKYIAQYLSTSTSTVQKRRKDLSKSTSTFIAVLTVLVQVPMYVALWLVPIPCQ